MMFCFFRSIWKDNLAINVQWYIYIYIRFMEYINDCSSIGKLRNLYNIVILSKLAIYRNKYFDLFHDIILIFSFSHLFFCFLLMILNIINSILFIIYIQYLLLLGRNLLI
jgi:hypothetical protein